MLVLSQAPFVVINYGAAVRVFRQEITSIQDKILFYYVHCTRTRCTVHYLCAILISIFDLTKAAAAQIVHINLDSSFRTGRQDVCIIPVKKSCSHFFTSIFFFVLMPHASSNFNTILSSSISYRHTQSAQHRKLTWLFQFPSSAKNLYAEIVCCVCNGIKRKFLFNIFFSSAVAPCIFCIA